MSRLNPIRIIKSTNNINKASVIFLHGSGDTGKGIFDWVKLLVPNFALPDVKFLFPTAPLQPYTPLNGAPSHVWFDRADISIDVPDQIESIARIETDIKALIDAEVQSGVPLDKIIIGGFSMGGALALHAGYRFLPGLGGVFALSSFLNRDSIVYSELSGAKTPLYMCHGNRDDLVPLEWGERTFKQLQSLGVQGEFHEINNAMHELKKGELKGLLEWIGDTLN